MVPKQTTPVKYKCGHTKEVDMERAIGKAIAEAYGKRFICPTCRSKELHC